MAEAALDEGQRLGAAVLQAAAEGAVAALVDREQSRAGAGAVVGDESADTGKSGHGRPEAVQVQGAGIDVEAAGAQGVGVAQLQQPAAERGAPRVAVAARDGDIAVDHQPLRRAAGVGQGQTAGHEQRTAKAAETVGVVGRRDITGIGLGAHGTRLMLGRLAPPASLLKSRGAELAALMPSAPVETGLIRAEERLVDRIAGQERAGGADGYIGGPVPPMAAAELNCRTPLLTVVPPP